MGARDEALQAAAGKDMPFRLIAEAISRQASEVPDA